MVFNADAPCPLEHCEDCCDHASERHAQLAARLQLVDEVRSDQLTRADAPLPGCIARALRRGQRPTDRVFDRLLPRSVRRASARYWTPLAVTQRAAEWFQQLGVRSVVDIGSGAGKFCVATALCVPARFTGIEQRAPLLAAACELARRFELEDRVTFVHGRLGDAPLPQADAYYLYNPFGENLFGPDGQLDGEAELSHERYLQDVARVEQLLQEAALGTCVLTYNGFGGEIPSSYREVYVDRELPNLLRLWRKTSEDRGGRRERGWSSDAEEIQYGVDERERVGWAARHEQ
jgi:predicted RNA methylase